MSDGFDFIDDEGMDSAKQAENRELAEQADASARSIEFLLDVPLDVAVEIGRCRMLVHDLLQLGQGAVVELDKLAGEPLDVLINNRLIARGEAVVVNERFGLRLTEIISPIERLERLKE